MSPQVPRIAVLLASYNGVRWLPDQIQSILDQDGVAPTIFVSDDGSSDGSMEWLHILARSEPRVQILPPRNGPRSVGANFIYLFTQAPIDAFDAVAFADQDDIWFKDKLARHHVILQEREVMAVSSDVIALWPNGEKQIIRKSQAQCEFDHLFEAPGPGCTFLMRPALIAQLRPLLTQVIPEASEFPYHDWLVYALSRSMGFAWHIDDQPSMFYRQHAGNVLGANQGILPAWRRLRVIYRGEYKREVLDLASMCAKAAPDQAEHLSGLLRMLEQRGVWHNMRRAYTVRRFRRNPRDRRALGLAFVLGWW